MWSWKPTRALFLDDFPQKLMYEKARVCWAPHIGCVSFSSQPMDVYVRESTYKRDMMKFIYLMTYIWKLCFYFVQNKKLIVCCRYCKFICIILFEYFTLFVCITEKLLISENFYDLIGLQYCSNTFFLQCDNQKTNKNPAHFSRMRYCHHNCSVLKIFNSFGRFACRSNHKNGLSKNSK